MDIGIGSIFRQPDTQGRIKVVHVITRLDRGGSAQNTLLTCLGLTERYELVVVLSLIHI